MTFADANPNESIGYAWKTPLGWFAIVAKADALIGAHFDKDKQSAQRAMAKFCTSTTSKQSVKTIRWLNSATGVLASAKQQTQEYFQGKRQKFDLVLDFSTGSTFQKAAWKALLKIPYGKTISYGEQAKMVGNPNAARAIGGANGSNRLPLFIPCHRVVAHDGSIGGYSGGLHIKHALLRLENEQKN